MLVSIIIPIYKAEPYLPKCIESVLAQTLTDFELLLVDDGSPDRSGAICDEYAARDARIRVFHNPNGGASRARNCGLDHASGDFVAFIDADDWVESDHLEQLAGSGIKENGIAYTNLMEEWSGYTPRPYPMPDCRVQQGAGTEACMAVIARLMRARCFGWTCNKLFSRATIERLGLRFEPDLHYAEDEVFTIRYCAHVDHMVCNSRPTYHYRYVATSLLHGQVGARMLLDTRILLNGLYEQLGYSREVIYLSARTHFSRLRRALRHVNWNSPLADELAETILNSNKRMRSNVSLRFCKGIYDIKVLCIAWLCCTPRSPFWVKLTVKSLHL